MIWSLWNTRWFMPMVAYNDDNYNFLSKNPLFEGFSEYQLQHILPLIEEISFPSNHLIIEENEISDNLYIVKHGKLIVEKWDAEIEVVQKLATLGVNAIVGELSILDDAPRSASVKTLEPTTVLVLAVHKLRDLSKEETTYTKIVDRLSELANEAKILVADSAIYPQLIQNIAKNLGKRLRNTNDSVIESLRKELRHERARAVMGKLIITVIVILSVYIVVLKLLEEMHYKFFNSTIVSAPLIAVFGVIVFFAIKKTGYPLRYYGLTLRGWRASVKEAIPITLVMLILMVGFKWLLIHTTKEYSAHPIFEFKIANHSVSRLTTVLAIGTYLLFVPLQELIVRGALQSSFQELLLSEHKIIMSILLSNLLFSVTHFHISIVVGLSVFLPGLFWGWMYSRHRTLVGVSLSHQIFGIWALSIVGL